jgi:thymidine kinase
MFSGKTTQLIKTHQLLASVSPVKKIVVVNYAGDTRYNNDVHLVTSHDGATLPCRHVFDLASIMPELLAADVVMINEAQFFPDLQPVVLDLVNEYGKHVYVYGLDGDFRHERFGSVLDLISECDDVVKLRAVCFMCGMANHAIFSQRLSGESEQIVIGSNNYTPLCRKCHLTQKAVYA